MDQIRLPSRRISRPLALLACCGLAACVWTSVAATTAGTPSQDHALVADPMQDGTRRPLTGVDLRYARENSAHPSTDDILNATVRLGQLADGYTQPREGVPAVTITLREVGSLGYVYDAALPVISQAIVARMRALGMLGVYAEPDPAMMRVEHGAVVDARTPDQTRLTYLLTTGRVTQVRTVGLGDRLSPDENLNNPVHARIRHFSPLRAVPPGDTSGASDLMRTQPVDDYVHRLNRHEGRRVDVAVAPTGEDTGAVTLDYLVTERRPWILYAQAKRDGSRATDEWRYGFGFIHNQLTNTDDTLSVDWLTSFDNVQSVRASYERPFPDSERLRARVYGSWYEYTAADVGLPDATFEGDGWSLGGEVIWNFFQRDDLFLDAVGGVRVEHVSVDNQLADVSGDDEFVIGHVGVRLSRKRDAMRTFASATLEFSLDGASEEAQQALGRTNADENWALLRADASHSFFIEPLLDPNLNEHVGFAHEVALRAAGQASLGSRLVPNFQDVVGGLYTVRGYPEAIVAGDHTLVASAEYRLHIPALLSPEKEPGTLFGEPFRWKAQYAGGPTDWDLIGRAFVDVGWVGNVDKESFERNQTLVGAGLGVELQVSRHFNARIDFGWALKELENADGSTLIEVGDVQWHFLGTIVY